MTDNHTFSKHDPDSYRADPLFSIDRRHNALTINPNGSHVRVVSNDTDGDDQLDDALRAAGADLLGGQYPYARAGFVRGALRPASRGAGRGRFR